MRWIPVGGTGGGGGSTVSPATTVTGPDAYGAAAVVGVSLLYARADHDHGLPAAIAVPGPATTVTGPDAYGAAAVVGTSLLYARADHDHGLPAAIAPATTVTGPDAYGAAAVVGTSALYARADHDHGLPAAPAVPSPATTVTGPDAYGAAAVVGTSALYARADHDHGLPAAPSPALTNTQAAGSGTTITTTVVALTGASLSLAAGTWLILGHVVIVGAVSATGVSIEIWNNTDSGSLRTAEFDGPLLAANHVTLTLSHIVTLAATKTIILRGIARGASVTASTGVTGLGGPSTYIAAIKIA